MFGVGFALLTMFIIALLVPVCKLTDWTILVPAFCLFLLVPFNPILCYNVERECDFKMENRYIIDGQRVSADEYNKRRYEDLRIRVPAGRKEEIRSHALARGESVNAFVGRAITETLERDGQ